MVPFWVSFYGSQQQAAPSCVFVWGGALYIMNNLVLRSQKGQHRETNIPHGPGVLWISQPNQADKGPNPTRITRQARESQNRFGLRLLQTLVMIVAQVVRVDPEFRSSAIPWHKWWTPKIWMFISPSLLPQIPPQVRDQRLPLRDLPSEPLLPRRGERHQGPELSGLALPARRRHQTAEDWKMAPTQQETTATDGEEREWKGGGEGEKAHFLKRSTIFYTLKMVDRCFSPLSGGLGWCWGGKHLGGHALVRLMLYVLITLFICEQGTSAIYCLPPWKFQCVLISCRL